jgi:hypothetical protein
MIGIVWNIKEKFAQEAEVKRQLEEIRDGLCEEITNEIDAIMEKVKQTAIMMCPKVTNALASSISLTGGAISAGSMFYEASISAGDESIVNPISGKPTSEYAELVESGHVMRDGMFWSGIPFLEDAMMAFEDELSACVEKGLKELGVGD